jgi:tRNA A37 threonylcarbamoyladenosine synthetase subunit TsaC/SUA5/YrdC
MKEIHVEDERATSMALDCLHGSHGIIMMEMPAVFILVAPATLRGVEALHRAKNRLPGKNYGTAIGNLDSFHALAGEGSLPQGLQTAEEFKLLTGAFIRVALGPEGFQSPVVRHGRHQGLLVSDGPHRQLFCDIEASFRHLTEPGLFNGHRFTAPLCTSANISGDPLGSITDLQRALDFGHARNIPLLLRSEPASGETGSYPIFSLSPSRISIERHGPGEEHIKSLLPAALFE